MNFLKERVYMMDLLVIVVISLCLVVGIIGTVAPAVPGVGLLLVAALLGKFLLPGDPISWWTVVLCGVGVVLSWVIDFLGIKAGQDMTGGTKWGFLGASIGLLLGIFFFPIGLILGPVAGAFLGEWIFARKEIGASLKSGLGAAAGIGIATLIRLIMALALVSILILDWLFLNAIPLEK